MEIATRRCPRLRVVWDLREGRQGKSCRSAAFSAAINPAVLHEYFYKAVMQLGPINKVAQRTTRMHVGIQM